MNAGMNVGDVVRLKSGGPKMTVQNIGDYSYYGILHGATCVWFDENKAVKNVFPIDALEKVE